MRSATPDDVDQPVVRLRDPTFIDVLDRVLDKGIVIDFDIDVTVIGLKAIGFSGHVTVMSVEQYIGYAKRGVRLDAPPWFATT
jgi:hypothetical protein